MGRKTRNFFHPASQYPNYPNYGAWLSIESDSAVHKLKASGTEARGPSRTFAGKLTANEVDLGGALYGNPPSAAGSISVSYQVILNNFQLDVSAGSEIRRLLNKPRDKQLDAYAFKNWRGLINPASPIEFFWGGSARYGANVTQDLLTELNNPKYEWNVTGAPLVETQEARDGSLETVPDKSKKLPSTPSKTLSAQGFGRFQEHPGSLPMAGADHHDHTRQGHGQQPAEK